MWVKKRLFAFADDKARVNVTVNVVDDTYGTSPVNFFDSGEDWR